MGIMVVATTGAVRLATSRPPGRVLARGRGHRLDTIHRPINDGIRLDAITSLAIATKIATITITIGINMAVISRSRSRSLIRSVGRDRHRDEVPQAPTTEAAPFDLRSAVDIRKRM